MEQSHFSAPWKTLYSTGRIFLLRSGLPLPPSLRPLRGDFSEMEVLPASHEKQVKDDSTWLVEECVNDSLLKTRHPRICSARDRQQNAFRAKCRSTCSIWKCSSVRMDVESTIYIECRINVQSQQQLELWIKCDFLCNEARVHMAWAHYSKKQPHIELSNPLTKRPTKMYSAPKRYHKKRLFSMKIPSKWHFSPWWRAWDFHFGHLHQRRYLLPEHHPLYAH